MGKKSFNKRRVGGKRGGDGSGAGDPGVELMEVVPASATAKIESTILAKQRAILPSSVQKVDVPSLEAFIAAKKAEDPEEALRALNIPDLRGIVSTNDEPRVCAHCSATLPDGIIQAVADFCAPCGGMVCNGCFADHKRLCRTGRSFRLVELSVKAGAPWALYQYALACTTATGSKLEPLAVPMLKLAADAGHPNACHLLSAGYVMSEQTGLSCLDKLPVDIVSAAKYAERALVLDSDTYIGESQYILETSLRSLVKDGRLQEARKMAALLAQIDYEGAKLLLSTIEKSTFGPFYDHPYLSNEIGTVKHSTILSVDFLTQRDMSPEELRLGDYEAGDGILRILCATLQGLSKELAIAGSSCPLRAGLATFIDSTLYLMGQTANLDLYRSIPTLICKVADEVAEMQPSCPKTMLECESFLLLLLTSVAAKCRMGQAVTRLCYDRGSHAMTSTIANNANLPAHIRGLALVLQADAMCYLPYRYERDLPYRYESYNKPKEAIIRRRARALSLSVEIHPSCPLESLASRLLVESGERLAAIGGNHATVL